MPTTLTRDQWIDECAKILAGKYGEPEPDQNLKEWAAALAPTYFDGDPVPYSPQQAVDEDLSCA